MRVKPFIAATTAEAFASVRSELGDEAIIISTGDTDDGVVVLAAIEQAAEAKDLDEPDNLNDLDTAETVRQALTYHGASRRLIERLCRLADEFKAEKPIMLMGPPGAGKTVTAAKLCARQRLSGKPVCAITTDTKRAGGIDQLAAFMKILETDLRTAESAVELAEVLAENTGDGLVVVDTAGVNPYGNADMEELYELVNAGGTEPVLVLPGGTDAMEAADMARAFSDLGPSRLVATRLDVARRLGSVISAADAARLSFAEVGISPQVADGLATLTPVSLARLVMPHTDDTSSDLLKSEANP